MSNDKIFCDIDGVLVNFAKGYIREFYPGEIQGCGGEDTDTWEFYEKLGQTEEEFVETIEGLPSSFWADLPEFDWTSDLVETLLQIRDGDTDVILLSHSVSEASDEGKKESMQRLGLGHLELICVRDSGSKADYCGGPNHLLIDDKFSNCEDWLEVGGNAMLLSTNYNIGEDWHGGMMFTSRFTREDGGYPFEQQIADVIECPDAWQTLSIDIPDPARHRKEAPVFSGVLQYFPKAIMEIARVSRIGNEQHNPGQPLQWDRSKSGDELDALARHLLEAGCRDTDGVLHSAKVAWRALANLEKELERLDNET